MVSIPESVVFAGSRYWRAEASIRRELERLRRDLLIIHGACTYGGADWIADRIARELGFTVVPVAAPWPTLGRAAGPVRNALMLDLFKPQMVLAFHPDIGASRGTGGLVLHARQRHIEVHIFRE